MDVAEGCFQFQTLEALTIDGLMKETHENLATFPRCQDAMLLTMKSSHQGDDDGGLRIFEGRQPKAAVSLGPQCG